MTAKRPWWRDETAPEGLRVAQDFKQDFAQDFEHTICRAHGLMHHNCGRWTDPFLQLILLVRREGAGVSDFSTA
jgi:hypothetical protein